MRNSFRVLLLLSLVLPLASCSLLEKGKLPRPGKIADRVQRGAEHTEHFFGKLGDVLASAFPAAALTCYGVAAAAGGTAALLKLRRRKTKPTTTAQAARGNPLRLPVHEHEHEHEQGERKRAA